MSDNPKTPLPESPEKIGNLTLHRGTVKPNVTAAPLDGYKVVVFEKISGGTRFITILNPEDQPLKEKTGLFSAPREYNCYAVSSDIKLNFIFNTTVTLSAQHQQIDLKCTVYYYVSSPRHIVLRIDTDPLKRIQEEIEVQLQQNFLNSRLNIQHIQDKCYQIKDTILPYPTLNQLREFAKDFGIIINDIDMTCTVPPKYLEPEKIREDHLLKKKTADVREDEKLEAHKGNKENLQQKHELEEAEADQKNRLKDKENLQDGKNTMHQLTMANQKSFNDLMVKTVTEFADRLINTDYAITSPITVGNDINNSIKMLHQMLGQFQVSDGKVAITDNRILAGEGSKNTLLAKNKVCIEESSTSQEIKQFLSTLQSEVEATPDNDKSKDQMLNCIDHLLNEINYGVKADPDALNKYTEKIQQHIGAFLKFLSHKTLTQEAKFKEKMAQLIAESVHDTSDS